MKRLMGIINLTDNSFIEASRVDPAKPDNVLERMRILLADYASIIDIGACSTAPGNGEIDEETEWKRLEGPLRAIFTELPHIDLSVDTFRPGIVRRIIDLRERTAGHGGSQTLGRLYVNDVKAAAMDDDMLSTVAAAGLGYIAMDSGNDPFVFFEKFALCAEKYGIGDWIVDPGFGFGKSIERNWEILNDLGQFKCFGKPILAALSRKRMIWIPFNLTPSTCAEQSIEAEKLAFSRGADIVRTHDVAAHHLYRPSPCRT